MRNKKGQFAKSYAKEKGAIFAFCFIVFIIALTHWKDWVSPLVFENFKNSTSTVVIRDPVLSPKPLTKKDIEAKIRHYFPRSQDTMVAIAKAESGLRNDAINYNCLYEGHWEIKNGKSVAVVTNPKVLTVQSQGVISTWCRTKEDRKKAWSVDCFVLMRNYPGRKTCPNITLDQHLKEVATLSKVQGLSSWSSYSTGTYENHK